MGRVGGMCLTVVGLSVGRGSFGGRRGLPYGGDEHNVDAATQGASPLQVTVLFLTSLSSGVFKQDWCPSSTAEPAKKDERKLKK